MEMIINLTIGLLIFMMSNVILGSLNSLFDKTFDWKKLFVGIAKALIVLGIYGGVYYAGSINPNLFVMEVDGTEVNIVTAIYLIGVSGFIAYGKQLMEKLKVLLTPTVKVKVKQE